MCNILNILYIMCNTSSCHYYYYYYPFIPQIIAKLFLLTEYLFLPIFLYFYTHIIFYSTVYLFIVI